jgi:glycosyltransferase involved in cell wall biosynthesis
MTSATIPDLTVLSATRHEAENVAVLTKRIGAQAELLGMTWEILFVDDSDDMTPFAIAALARAGLPVRMLHRPAGKRPGGLSGALTLGFASTSAPLLAVIDADLQHPPELLGALVDPLLEGFADITIASRYVPGGSAEGLAGPFRHWVSKVSTNISRVLFGRVRRVRDPVSGFFALRRHVLDDVDLRPEGFKILMEILVRGRWQKVIEVPYHFAGRLEGTSKVTPRLGILFLRHVGRLWLECEAPGPLRSRGLRTEPHRSEVVLTETDPRWNT